MSEYTLQEFFKAYDLRGLEPVLNEKVYYLFAKGYKELIIEKEGLPNLVSITHDMRLTGKKFYKALYHGLIEAGVEVKSYGLASTDMMYAACMRDGGSGMAVTASHNPKDYNGLKCVKKPPVMLGKEDGLFDIRDYILANLEACEYRGEDYPEPEVSESAELMDFFLAKVSEIGRVEVVNQTLAKQSKKLKVVVDTANAIAGVFMPKVQEMYPEVEFVPLYWEVDGNMPNHSADPTKLENLEALRAKVQSEQADFGCAFDGDGDRLVIVDEQGEIFNGHFLVVFMAQYFIQKAREDKEFIPAIVYAMPGSTCIPRAIYQKSGMAVPTKMGHTYIKQTMLELNSIYGGEHSGHHYFGAFGYMDSGLLTLAVFLDIYTQNLVPASSLTEKLANYYFINPEINFARQPEDSIESITEKLQTAYPEAEFEFLDGITAFFDDWKLNVRFSNTEPLIRLNIETYREDKITAKLAEVKGILGLK